MAVSRAADHRIDCEWHHDQYDHECTCGATARAAQRARTTTPAQELRELARDIWRLTGERRIASIAWPLVSTLVENLTLRARVMELENARDVRDRRDASRTGETSMDNQVKNAVRELKTTIERLNQAQSNPQQLQQVIQELQQKISQVESQLDRG